MFCFDADTSFCSGCHISDWFGFFAKESSVLLLHVPATSDGTGILARGHSAGLTDQV
jgi:hypothetical protein